MLTKLAIKRGRPIRNKPNPPWPFVSKEEKQAVMEVLNSSVVNYHVGNKGKEFEERFAHWIGAKYGISCNSGTSALYCALAAIGVGPGDEVITTPITFFADGLAPLLNNAITIFADIDPKTGNLDPNSTEKKISSRTKAIIPVHLYGHPADMDGFMELARKYNLYIIEDCAQSHGATYKERMTGSIGHIGAFSFCQTKIMTTGGEGGMLTTEDPEIAAKLMSARNIGAQTLYRDGKFQKIGGYSRLGHNMRMTEMQSAIGIAILKYHINEYIKKRRENSAYLSEKFKAFDFISPAYEAPKVKHTYYAYPARLHLDLLKVNNSQFIAALKAEGILVREVYSSPGHTQPIFENLKNYSKYRSPWRASELDHRNEEYPNLEFYKKKTILFEVHPTIDKEYLKDVVAAAEKVGEAYHK